MDKQKVIETYLKYLDEKIGNIESSLNSVQKQAQDAPGSNVSHSDTTKFQLSNVALGIKQRLALLKRLRAIVKNLGARECDRLEIGALFILKDLRSKEKIYYFLLPEQGGDSLEIESQEVTFVSSQAPIIEVVAKRIKGDVFDFRKRRFQLIDIC